MAAEDYHDMDQMFDPEYTMQFDEFQRSLPCDFRRPISFKNLIGKKVTVPIKKEKTMKLKNKFYVASDSVIDGHERSNWRKATLQDAVKHAQTLMSTAYGNNNVKYIVKIVAVVRQEKPPVSVEKVE